MIRRAFGDDEFYPQTRKGFDDPAPLLIACGPVVGFSFRRFARHLGDKVQSSQSDPVRLCNVSEKSYVIPRHCPQSAQALGHSTINQMYFLSRYFFEGSVYVMGSASTGLDTHDR